MFFSRIKLISTLLALSLSGWVQAAVVLQYHHVSDTTPKATSVTPELFRQHMEHLEAHDFDIVSLPELVEKLKRGEPLPDKTAAITFDDAYDSVYDVAFPMLKKRDWPFTVFVNTQPLDQGVGGFSTWEELREMAKHGASIANHTTRHNHLQRLKKGESQKEWQARITQEVEKAEERIKEETGQNHKMVAYPYGEYNNRVKQLLEDLGYVAFGQQSGPLASNSDLLAMPRFPFGGPFGDLEDFGLKAHTLPMPLDDIKLCADRDCDKVLDEVVVKRGQRPVLTLTATEKSLLPTINCFASGQGAIETWIQDKTLFTQPPEGLKPGRTRYNCTAGSGQRGRFYWFSQQWLVTDKDGNWVHED